jgi:hypothetical protein
MLNEIGEFVGDKIGAVVGQHKTSRLWIKGFGRRRRRIEKQRKRYAKAGRIAGGIGEWCANIVGFFFGKVV